MSQTRSWIVAVVVAAATAPSVARADSKNESRAGTCADDGSTTRDHVRGAQTPTCTVNRPERPSRVVVDVPQARLAEALRGHESASVLAANTWAVSTIAAQQIDDGGQLVRVIVTLARPGRYDVKTEGNEVVVMVTARDAAPKTANPAELEQAKAEAERLRKIAAEQAARAEALQQAADAAKRGGQQANQAELARVREDAARAKAAAQTAQVAADRARVDAEKAQKVAVADATRAREEAAKSRADAD